MLLFIFLNINHNDSYNILFFFLNILSLLNKIIKIKDKKDQTLNGDKFKFSNGWLTSVESKGYIANFSDYLSSGDYTYPTKISIKDGNSQIIYTFSNFKQGKS